MKKVFCGGDDGVGRRRKGGCTLWGKVPMREKKENISLNFIWYKPSYSYLY